MIKDNDMSKTRPLFTVVMPAYGVEKYLAKAVESIESQTVSGMGINYRRGWISG